MLKLNTLAPHAGARNAVKRLGRGPGSGHGKTAAKGHKGAKARSGYSASPGFEGGQMPLHRRLPKRGFNNISKIRYQLVSLASLETFESDTKVDNASLLQAGIIKRLGPVKILSNGELTRKIHVQVEKISAGAKTKILAAGGTIAE